MSPYKDSNLSKEKAPYKLFTENVMACIADRVYHRRQDMDMTEKEFAKSLGVSKRKVFKWESGLYNFPLSELVLLYKELGIDVGEFLINENND